MRICEQCGNELHSNAKFCGNCGNVVEEVATEPMEPTLQTGSYQIPTQTKMQSPGANQAPPQVHYQAQNTYVGQQAAVKQKKQMNPMIFILGGVVIAAIVIITVIIVLAGMIKGKLNSESSYVGKWNAVSVEMWGETFSAKEIFDGDFYLELLSNQTCKVQTPDGLYDYKWEETENDLSITLKGKTVFTCIKESYSLVVEDYMNTGMQVVFEKEGSKPSEEKDSTGQNTSRPKLNIDDRDSADDIYENTVGVQEKWNGSWYGYIYIEEAFGEWDEYEDEIFDAYMVIDVDENGNGTMAIFLGDDENQTIDTYILADENHFEVTEGEFWDCPLNLSQWWLALSPIDDGNLVVISDTYIDPELSEDDGFDYMFQFRPWGELWEKEEQAKQEGSVVGSKLPPNYKDYLATIMEGVDDPNKSKDGNLDESNGGINSQEDIYGSGKTSNPQIKAAQEAISAASADEKPTYEELCRMLGSKGRLNEYATPQENRLSVEWVTDTAAIRVDYDLVDGEYVFAMSETVGSYD